MPGSAVFDGGELAIRRWLKRDATFAAVWSDYQDAKTALSFWERECDACARKIGDYKAMVADLEKEIGDRLSRLEASHRPDPGAPRGPGDR